jgi:hypothetical protein
MGRGRAKAKQTKVARDLKYNSQQKNIKPLPQISRTRMTTILSLRAITFHVLKRRLKGAEL